MNGEQLAHALGGGRERRVGKSWRVPCPVPSHEDQHPSFDVADKNNRVVFVCRAGCAQDEVLDELRARSLWPARGEQTSRKAKPAFRWEDDVLPRRKIRLAV